MSTKQLINNVKYITLQRGDENVWFMYLTTSDNKDYKVVKTNEDAAILLQQLESGNEFVLCAENSLIRVDQVISHNTAPVYYASNDEPMQRFRYIYRAKKLATPKSSHTDTEL